MSTPLIEVSELCVHFDVRGQRGASLRAVDGVSFALEHGAALGLVGESGCGKTTTARAVAGLQRPSSGTIRIEGVDATQRSKDARARVQYVFQDPYASLDPRRLVEETLIEPLAIHGRGKPRERRLRALAALDACGLEALFARRYPHELSGGQRQRVAIARALVLEPELLVCDEPTSALDVSVRAQIVNLLCDLRARTGVALLFVSHDLAVVRRIAERIAVMYLGRIVEIGPRERIFGAPHHPYTNALLAAVPRANPAQPNAPLRLTGEPASALHPPTGCAFHPRCPRRGEVAGDRCASERPELIALGDAAVACHLHAP